MVSMSEYNILLVCISEWASIADKDNADDGRQEVEWWRPRNYRIERRANINRLPSDPLNEFIGIVYDV